LDSHPRRVDTTEGVVGTELEDDQVGAFAEAPLEACCTAARRLAGNAVIEDIHRQSPLAEIPLEHVGERLGIGQAVPCCQAVAEGQDAHPAALIALGIVHDLLRGICRVHKDKAG
jgi:hypothetical protein